MDQNNIYSVLITAITVLGGTAAWRFYEKRADRKERDEEFIRHDCRDRIAKLEALLVQSAKEKDELRTMVLDLTKQVAELRVTVEFLRAENEELEKRTKASKRQING
jgi:septal ring factor EnvC (AmiA/AmiB activator)